MTRAQILELMLGPNGQSVFDSQEAFAVAWDRQREKLSSGFERQWYAAGNQKDFTPVAEAYCRAVIAGQIVACLEARQACQRHLDELSAASDPAYPYRFDQAKASRVCRFIEMLPHVKGSWAARSELIVLSPWQVFSVCVIFGWLKKSTGKRRFTLAYIAVPRKNAKSTLAAGIDNYLFACDEEFGAEVYSGATSEKQGLEVFRPAAQMMGRSPELAKVLGVHVPNTPRATRMVIPEDGSRFEVVVGKPGDGASPHGGTVDEYHEHDDDTLFDTFRTGMGAREQPLELVITTSGDNLTGPCKLLEDDLRKILAGTIQRDEVFVVIYTIDSDMDWSDDRALEMANPNIGVSVFREFLISERAAALGSARKQGVFKTKHLNIWVGSSTAYFNLAAWRKCALPAMKLQDFLGSPAVVALDLSTKNDMTARVVTFKKTGGGKAHYYVFVRFYIPEAQVAKPENQHYQEWVANGWLIQHPGSSVDFEEIEREAIEIVQLTKAREFCFDPFNAHQFSQNVQKRTKAQIVEIGQNTTMLSPGTKELATLMGDGREVGRVHHEGNPVLQWNIGNIVAPEDRNENVFPQKPRGRDEQNIDGWIATIMTISRLMALAPKKSVYAERGLVDIGAPAPEAAYV